MRTALTKYKRFLKYCCVGVLNTIVTLAVICICKSVLNIDPYLSNAIGYIAGIINSFIWNKNWVFRSTGKYSREALKFAIGVASCYGVQLLVVWLINTSPVGSHIYYICGIALTGYGVATILGNIVYTICNYLYNRSVAFNSKA